MKESKLHMKGNVSKTFPDKNNSTNDSNWTSSRQDLQPNIEVMTITKSPFNESLHQMSENYDQKHNSRFHMAKRRSINNIFVARKSCSIMKEAYQYNHKSYQNSNSPSCYHYMLQNETLQHIQPAQNENSNAGGRKDQGLKYISLEQQVNRCHVSAYTEQMTRRGETKEPRVLNNDSNNRAHASFKKQRSISPIPGRFNLNDVEGDLPSDFPEFSPMSYEYTNASNNIDAQETMPHEHCAAAGNDIKKRQKRIHEMANRFQQNSESTSIIGLLPIFPRRSDYVTFLQQTYHTPHNADHHDQQNIQQLLKEERKQQHEYLPATLNFPYKDFVASTNNKTNESHHQLWCDEEEQSRLEKHFNPKWQVEFFSKFYTAGTALETPAIFGTSKPSSSKEAKNAVRNNDTCISEEDDEVVFVSTTSNTCKNPSYYHIPKKQRKDHSNDPCHETFRSPSASSDILSHQSILLEDAAMKLSAAMDDTDKTRDIIARIEMEMQVNRDEILKERIAYVDSSIGQSRRRGSSIENRS